MRINNFKNIDGEIVSDGEFHCLGSVDTKKSSVLTFAESDKYIKKALDNRGVTSLITLKSLCHLVPDTMGLIAVEDPKRLFYEIHNNSKNIFSINDVFETRIGENCNISSLAVISSNNVTIGNNVMIGEFVTIRDNVTLGDNVIIEAGCRIGGDGFQLQRTISGNIISVKHFGSVIIGSDVELRENVTIKRGLFIDDKTIIGNGTKIDSSTYISHNDEIGNNCLIAACVTICGSSNIGDDVWIAPGSVISSQIEICDKARILIGSVVIKSVRKPIEVSGNFAIKHENHLRNSVK